MFTKQLHSLENKIILKINNNIITTLDIKEEEKYLIVLNQNLKKIDQNKLKDLATNAIVKEKIKEIELAKYYEIKKALNEKRLEQIIKNLYQTVGFQNEIEFKLHFGGQQYNDQGLLYQLDESMKQSLDGVDPWMANKMKQ